jgi:hypothetical protein
MLNFIALNTLLDLGKHIVNASVLFFLVNKVLIACFDNLVKVEVLTSCLFNIVPVVVVPELLADILSFLLQLL